jgi:NADH-quinone oxidoreductase subunit M
VAVLDESLLSAIVFLPLLTALGLLVAGAFGSGLPAVFWRLAGLASTLLTFLLSLSLYARFDPTQPGFQAVEHRPWIEAWGVNYYVGVDGVNLLLVLLTTFLMPIVLAASWSDVTRSVKSWIFFMLALETGMIGAFVSLNLFQFYVFWEVMLIPMYFVIGIFGGLRRIHAAVKFFLFTMAGSLAMLVAMLVLAWLGLQQTGVLTFDLVPPPWSEVPGLLDTAVPLDGEWWQTQRWLFLAFALAFAIKVPLVPLHTWLPDAHVEAPTGGSVVLAGVLLKMGAYGFLRFALPLFPVAASEYAPHVLVLALVGVVYGSLVAMAQADLKRLVAYSSVAHLGYVMLGIFSFNLPGMNGSVLQMLHHGLATGALFLMVGMLHQRRHTHRIADFGGVARPMPVFAFFFGLVVLSSIGLPMLGGFVGEFLILIGTFISHPGHAVVATLGVVLTAAYMLWMYRRVMLGPVADEENRKLLDLGLREKALLVALAVPIVGIGVYPDPLLRRVEPSISELLRQVDMRYDAAIERASEAAAEAGS